MASDTRNRILAVASELFIEQGYDATSLREIADRLGFTKAALYYHFQSKDEIFIALLEPTEALVEEFMLRLEATEDVEGWADALDWVIGTLADHLDTFLLLERNRTAIAKLRPLETIAEHAHMHERVEKAVAAKAVDFGEQVRMIAALGAVSAFDDWAPRLIAEAPTDELQAHLRATVRDILRLPARGRRGQRRTSTRAGKTPASSVNT